MILTGEYLAIQRPIAWLHFLHTFISICVYCSSWRAFSGVDTRSHFTGHNISGLFFLPTKLAFTGEGLLSIFVFLASGNWRWTYILFGRRNV